MATEGTRNGSGNECHEPSDSDGPEVELINALVASACYKSFAIVVTWSFWRRLGLRALCRLTL